MPASGSTALATLEVIGSKQSYALKWRKPNNDNDDNNMFNKSLITRFCVHSKL